MRLTQQQIDDFNREGWLFLPELFSPEEVSLLAREAEGIYDTKRPEVWREKSGAPRTAFAAHLYNEAFRLLGAHPRMIDPVEQIFGEKVYMHQYKINAKSAFTGDVWQWHQDYGTWKRDDGMPQPRAMNIAIFLDEVMPINGPLMLVPRSQHAGDLKASHDLATTSYPLWTLDEETVTRLVREGGIVAPTGKAGGLLMFHGNLVHGSAGNITPYPRKIVYLTLNAVSNYIRTPDAAGIHRPSRFHADPDGRRRRAAAARARPAPGGGVRRVSCPGRSAARSDALPSRGPHGTHHHHGIPALRSSVRTPHRVRDTCNPIGSSFHEPLSPSQRPPRRRQAGPRRADRRRQVRLDVPVAGAAYAGAGGARDRRSRSRARARSLPDRRLGFRADRSDHVHGRRRQSDIGEYRSDRGSHRQSRRRHQACPRGDCARGKHIVMVNVEADVLAGPLLAEEARSAGVVYSLAYGDQPALTAEMVDWARATGFRVVAAGKGTKYLPAYHDVTPAGVWGHYGLTADEAQSAGMNPQMFNSFLDGTKSAIEMAAIANATGLRGSGRRAEVSALRRRRSAACDAAARQGRRAGEGGPGGSGVVARARRPSGVPRSALGRLRRAGSAERLCRRLLQAIRAEDRFQRPLRGDVQAVSSDRARAEHLDSVGGAARRADRAAARFPRRRRRGGQARACARAKCSTAKAATRCGAS